MATDGPGYVAILVGMAQPMAIPIDPPPGKPAPRKHFPLERTVGLQIWKYSQGGSLRNFLAIVKTFSGNGRDSHKHINTPRRVNSKSRVPSGNALGWPKSPVNIFFP